MMAPLFPFTAIVGLEPLKLALQLAVLDPHLSVLARGERGAGKSTAARAVGALMGGAPFVNLPVGTTEDRLLGGLDVERAMKGEPSLKRGMLAEAHGGVLYIDEVNLLPDHLADALLDAVASGTHVVEREGFSVTQDARFVLLGSMNPEEGSLRPQLLDRFALSVDVAAPMDPTLRREAVNRRLQFDADPIAFNEDWQSAQDALVERFALARLSVGSVPCSAELLDYVATQVCERGVRSLRADLATIRASRALAALEGAPTVTRAHIDAVFPLVVGHRTATRPPSPPPRAQPPLPSSTPQAPQEGEDDGRERVFPALETQMPHLVVRQQAPATAGQATHTEGVRRGVVIGTHRSAVPAELDVRGTLLHAVIHSGTPRPSVDDLHEKVRAPTGGRRFVFVIDASGSQAARRRIQLVKGAVAALLRQSVRRRDEVVLIAFRGTTASVVLPPTTDIEAANAAIAYLPTGGRTPLAHGLELATQFITDGTTVILLTDGRANVPSQTNDPWADALHAAADIVCPAAVVDSDSGPHVSEHARDLAAAMGATYLTLDGMDGERLLELVAPPARLVQG